MWIVVFGFIFILNFWCQFWDSKIGNFFIALITLSIFYTVFFGVIYSADFEGYSNIFEYSDYPTDFVFRYLSTIFTNYGLTFYELYQFHIILYGLLFTFFISRFTNNIFLVLIFFSLILYVPLVNQIRYYLGFAFFINAIYFLYFTKKKLLTYFLILLSILSHSAIILFYGFLLLNKFSNKNNYLKRCVFISALFFIVIFSLDTLGLNAYLGNYTSYFTEEQISTYSGGIYNILPYAILLILLYYREKKIVKKFDFLQSDLYFQILYKLSLYSIIFIPASIIIQIFGHRYVHSSLILWFCFYLYTLKFENSFKEVINQIIILTFISIGLFYYTYFFSEIILEEQSYYLKEFVKSFNSIDYLPNIQI